MHNLITFSIVFTNKNGGGGINSTPLPPSKLGVKNFPSKLRLTNQNVHYPMKIERERYFFYELCYLQSDFNKSDWKMIIRKNIINQGNIS